MNRVNYSVIIRPVSPSPSFLRLLPVINKNSQVSGAQHRFLGKEGKIHTMP